MRARLSLCVLILICVPPLAAAQTSARSDAEVLVEAEAAFRQGVANKTHLSQARKHFARATDAYRELHRRGIRSAALYRNFGNAAVLADRWPEAIWAYHVGLRLDPNDRAMRQHLAFARAKVIHPPSDVRHVEIDYGPDWIPRLSICQLSCLCAVLYVLSCIIATWAFLAGERWLIALTVLLFFIVWLGYFLYGRRTWLILLLNVVVFFGAAASVSLWREVARAETDRQTPLVVIVDNTDVFQGNSADYPKHEKLPRLPRGYEVRQLHRRGAWLQIRVANKDVGWVHADHVLVVEP